MTNKEAIDILQNYFMKQNKEDITRFAANAIIDLGRFMNITELDERQRESLLMRTANNLREAHDLITKPSNDHRPIKFVSFE